MNENTQLTIVSHYELTKENIFDGKKLPKMREFYKFFTKPQY